MNLTMQEEIQNNSDWKNRLHGLENPPGERPYASSAAWEKLHSRLDSKKRNFKPVWWFLAAACTILIVFLLAIHQPEKVKINNVSKKETNPYPIAKQNQPKISSPQHPSIAKQKSIHSKKSSPQIKFQQAVDSVIQVPPTPVALPVESTDVVKAGPPIVIPKKKLRVMHINELEPTDDEIQQQLAQQEKTKHSNSNNLIKSYVSNSTSDKVLKITISPSN